MRHGRAAGTNSGGPRGRSARAAAAALCLTLVAAGATAASGVDERADDRPAATGTVTRPRQSADRGPRLELLEQTFAVAPDGTMTLAYRLTGLEGDPLELEPEPVPETTTPPDTTTSPTTPTAPPTAAPTTTVAPPLPVELTLQVINYTPVTDPADVARVVGSDVDPATFDAVSDVVDGVALDARPLISPGDDGSVELRVSIGTDVVDSVEDRLKLDQPGIHPIRIQLLVGDPDDDRVVATAGTVVQRLPGPTDPVAAPPIDVSVVVATPEPAPNAPEEDLVAGRALDAAVDFAADYSAGATLQLPPSLVADAAATPASATALAEALSDDELVPMPVVPLDVSSAVAADRGEAYTGLVIAGEELLTDAVPTTPIRRDVWIATSAISGAGAQLLRDLGTRFVVMTEDAYRSSVDGPLPPPDLFVWAALPDGGTLPLIVLDPLSAELTSAAADDVLADATTAEWAVTTVAEMLVEQARDDVIASTGGLTRPERSRVLSTPDLAPPDIRLLDALHDVTMTTPSVQFTVASSLTGVTDVARRDGEPVSVSLPETAGPSLTDRIALLDATALTMASAASMLPPDDPRPAAWATELESLISTAYSDAEVLAATAEMANEARQLRQSIVLPEPFTFTLTGRRGTIEVRLGNTNGEPLAVSIHMESTKVTFPSGDQTVTLRPGDETSVVVPVEARANGTSSIELTVSTPAGEAVDDPVTLTARVTALTGLGQVLTAGFVLVLLTWWFTHWRSRRRARSAADDDGPGEEAGEEAGEDAGEEASGQASKDEGRRDEVESDSL